MCRFYISLFLILHQVAFSTSFDCSPIAYSGEKCNITRYVPNTVNTLTWRKDGVTQVSSTYQATNSCALNPPSTDYAEYCLEDSTNRIFILEILNPENHAGGTFSNPTTTDKTKIDLMEPPNLSSDNITTNIPSNITQDVVSLSVTVPCSKPQPTFTWIFTISKSTRSFSIENSQISTDSTGCTPPLLQRISTLKVADLKSEINETSGDIDITVDVTFGDYKTVSTKTVTTQFILPEPSDSECCRCHYNLIVLIIKAALIVLVIIVVIIHFCRREAKKCGTVYWALNILLIIGGFVCVILAIVQIVFLTDESDDSCQDTCQEEAGCDAAIAFVVLGFITAVLSIGFLILRLKNRDQKKKQSDGNKMKPGSEKEKNGTSGRTLPEPKRT